MPWMTPIGADHPVPIPMAGLSEDECDWAYQCMDVEDPPEQDEDYEPDEG